MKERERRREKERVFGGSNIEYIFCTMNSLMDLID